ELTTFMLFGMVNLALAYEIIKILGAIWWIFSILVHPDRLNLSEFHLKSSLYGWLTLLIFNSISFLIALNIRKLIHLIKKEEFFEKTMIRTLKLISILILSSVLMEASLQYLNYFHNAKYAIFQGWEFKSLLEKSIIISQSQDLWLVFLSGIIFLISIAFKRGFELKQQASLTI
ncbi:MAG: hypothetical protein ABIO44_09060, partial [Saprospiraceae bacterium]